ncbi:fumarylacetoacetate hydrolase family protein [Coprothermobacteraceae bacterium]|nr:fumarylacetoacetate hydrolase family protein [Coprothermobacteraceae bacterium]
MFVNGSFMEWKQYGYEDLLAPCIPRKAVCVGLNYKSHIEEMHQAMPESPTLFIKPSTAVIGPNDYIVLPPESERVDYEGELAVVIRDYAYRVSKKEAHKYILGYTIANDVTARDLQSKDGQWTRSKSFNTFLPLGPWIETDVDPTNLNLRTLVNGEVKQQGNTSDLLFDVFDLVSFISHVMTLEPYDVILTGTPAGVGPLKAGDEVVIEIEGIGRLVNRVRNLQEGEG